MDRMLVYVETIRGKTIALQMKSRYSLEILKLKIKEKEGLPPVLKNSYN